MEQIGEEDVMHISPYVLQIEKFAHSLKLLSHTFLQLEGERQTFTNREIEEMFVEVKERVCISCEKCGWCWGENRIRTYQMGYEILAAIENYGNELNIEMKRKLQNRCIHSGEFLEEILGIFRDAKQDMLWERKLAKGREGCAEWLNTFADMICMESRELEDSIVVDSRTEKKLEQELQKIGVKVLCSTFLLTEEGKYEIYLTACARKGVNVSYQKLAEYISTLVGKRMVAQDIRIGSLGSDYSTTIFIEGAAFYMLYGVARIGKDCDAICGDNFMAQMLPGGKQCIALSDGMGSGENASRESGMVIDLLEELLAAGYPEATAIQMINKALVMGREEILFSTLDMCSVQLYSGKCHLYKAGASSTFIKRNGTVEHISSSSLPVGVVQNLHIDDEERQLEDGDFIIMVTDGIMDALPVGEQIIILKTIIQGTDKKNAKEMAHHILEQVLEWIGRNPVDDMTVLVASLWRFL